MKKQITEITLFDKDGDSLVLRSRIDDEIIRLDVLDNEVIFKPSEVSILIEAIEQIQASVVLSKITLNEE